MLQAWIEAAERDEPVWLADVRESSQKMPDAARLIVRLERFHGELRDFPLWLPRWQDERQRRFVGEYVGAYVFNILSALSGRRMTFYYDMRDRQVDALLRQLPQLFQVASPQREGYGKVINVANRLGHALGGGSFCFDFRTLDEHAPLPEPASAPSPADLAVRLRQAAAAGERGLLCGVDVGGTDIKLALAKDGELLSVWEYDWDPSACTAADEIIGHIVGLIRRAVNTAVPGALLDGLGVSFPDVVIRDRIVGGETPKTRGMRANAAVDYETAFAKLTALREHLAPLCRTNAPIRLTNDGHMAAFSAAMELACCGHDEAIAGGVIAHTLGTDLGTGWLSADGTIPESPMEFYDFLLDLGSWPSREREPLDLRSVRNENSGLPGARRYLGQSAAFRLAYELSPELLDGFTVQEGQRLTIQMDPDMRKPCLESLMLAAQNGDTAAAEVFRRIGFHLGQISREMDHLMRPDTDKRFLFGRFTKHPACFALLQEGCAISAPELTLVAADESLAYTPLMRALSQRKDVTVAQFGQAVGSIYFSLM